MLRFLHKSRVQWMRLSRFRYHSTSGKGGTDAGESARKQRLKSTLYYLTAGGIFAAGASYAAVPLYRMFCQAYSYGGTTTQGHDADKVETMQKIEDRILKIRFNADIAASMRWNFKPQQYEIKVVPGETALAFYTARNPTDHPVTGISTYNVLPFEAGAYFNKIQCFCFEEQQLNPHEEVDMPVFFYIDPEFTRDPKLENVDTITLSYTFFESKEGLKLQMPSYARPHVA
ncbi:cytochrome c oxidase assembly protein COX11, mitochondrial-like [Rhagoletis pomonella]|uniref:cytochrome c oxidase assembly protein COX11, mitochondrial-like n=1 Tax=Rhagoletis pomonella TaxID=28610 RepID=UPI0017860C7A|nr:cytochrome c oxidase assembly protein COX11, mitochondrial-like [Rhagoletis pomonella]